MKGNQHAPANRRLAVAGFLLAVGALIALAATYGHPALASAPQGQLTASS